jgi:hypothetical protein
MAYLVQKTWGNGYYCCCHSSCDGDPEWVTSLQEALQVSGLSIIKVPDHDLEEVIITDGTTGQVVAQGNLDWIERGDYSRWYGHVEGKVFDIVWGGNPGETWEELNARRNKEKALKALEEAEKKAAEARKVAEL